MKRRLLGLTVLIWALYLPVFAQDTASITGTVTDPSGAAVSGAQVILDSADRGVKRTANTNESGSYLFAALPISSYDLTVTAPGFKKYEAKGIVLQVAQKARVDVGLQVGATSTEVTV